MNEITPEDEKYINMLYDLKIGPVSGTQLVGLLHYMERAVEQYLQSKADKKDLQPITDTDIEKIDPKYRELVSKVIEFAKKHSVLLWSLGTHRSLHPGEDKCRLEITCYYYLIDGKTLVEMAKEFDYRVAPGSVIDISLKDRWEDKA